MSANVLSYDATPITLRPTPGAPAEYTPFAPLLPIAATTTTPLATSASAATAVGYCGQFWNAAPMLMLTTCMPSLYARSMAASMMSALVDPSQPNTRYAPKVTPGATPRTPPAESPVAPMMPATCVPCPLQSSGSASGCGT